MGCGSGSGAGREAADAGWSVRGSRAFGLSAPSFRCAPVAPARPIGLFLGACAAGGGSDGAGSSAEAAPAGHPLAQVTHKMSPEQVREILGQPDSQHTHRGAIWKNFIPYYYGADSGTRIAWGYAG